MRMYFLHLTITLLALIAHVHCGTLRQYGRDWLIPKPAPQVDSKRITAKSVFIAPSFNQNVRCASGFSEDASGRCIKLVHVNQAAQLDFLLQRLNAMYGAPIVNHSEKQPLQVAVEIPVEPLDGSSLNDTSAPFQGDEMYSQPMPPEEEVSVDLSERPEQPDVIKETTTENTTKENGTEVESTLAEIDQKPAENDGLHQTSTGLTVLPDIEKESEENETYLIIKPNKEYFQVDEEPIVTLTSIDDDDDDDENSFDNTQVDAEKDTLVDEDVSDEELPDRLASIYSEDAEGMAAVAKNVSNVIKKETLLTDSSVSFMSVSGSGPVLSTNQTFKDTYLNKTRGDVEDHKVDNKQDTATNASTHYADIFQAVSTENKNIHEKTETEKNVDETTNEIHTNSSDVKNKTSSEFDDATTRESTTVTSSTQGSTLKPLRTEVSTIQMPTTQPWATDLGTQDATTLKSTTQLVPTWLPTSLTDEGYDEATEQNVNSNKDLVVESDGERVEDVTNRTDESDFDYPIHDVDLEVDYDDESYPQIIDSGNLNINVNKSDKQYPAEVIEGIYDGSIVPSVNDSVNVDGGEITIGDLNGDENVQLNSMKTIEKTLYNGTKIPDSNGTNPDELLSVFQKTGTGVKNNSETPIEVYGESFGDYFLHSSSSIANQGAKETLKTDSTSINVDSKPHTFPVKGQSVSQIMQQQPIIVPEHSVHIVYPQPVIQVMSVNQGPRPLPMEDDNHKEPISEHKENVDPNPQPTHFHNLNQNPSPEQIHNSNPFPQIPQVDKAPLDNQHNFGDFPYSPVPPQSEIHRPNLHLHHRPHHHHNPHKSHHPQNNPNHNGQSGFVRFPTDPVQLHRQPHPHSNKHDEEVNTVRFPQEDPRSNDKYSRWGNWRFDESRGHRPEQRFWAGGENTQNPQGTNRRNYWIDNRPNRRRQQPNYYN